MIGLDCAPPEYVFERWRERLPNLSRLIDRGLWGELTSTVPPITVPAWASMLSSKDPGTLGVYGFRNRADHSYDKLVTANARSIAEDRVWDLLSRAGKRAVLIGVPQTYPPKPLNGVMVSCFLTPTIQSNYTYPPELKDEIAEVVGEYVLDVHDFRTEDKQRILDQIWEMTEKRFKLARHLLRTREWDFFMLHEIGPDRIHHGFWRYMDPEHPKHEPGNPYQDVIPAYYERLDAEIGRLLELVPDHAAVLVASDHGAKRMDGGICLNEWLMNEGYLHLLDQPPGVVPIERCTIDWSRTVAWGSGGYYGRVFLNVKGREPQGVIEPSDYERVRDTIAAKVAAICDPAGNNIHSRAYKPEEVYVRVKGVPPDLIVYFGDLYWRAVGSVGYGGAIHTFDNDTGPDDANHAQEGIFVMTPSPTGRTGRVDGLHLMDVAPTILHHFGLPVPSDMQGRRIA
jgi:predicted AlkP superfamily phosphohydrolase/phosphomutase